VKATVDAVFQGGVFRPVQRPGFLEGEHVRMTVESVRTATPEEIFALATHVYDGLSDEDIDEIEEMAQHRPFFTDSPE
jgi:predicted DNA-binding antitoxin AbrB/MazE fold protein